MSSRTLAVILVATAAMVITWGFYAFFAREVTHFIEGKHHWFHNYEPWSLMGFICVFIVSTSLFLPAQPFVVAVGYLFGFHFLTILFTVAVYALASFLMFNGARFWFRPIADNWLREHKVVLGMARYVKDPIEGAKLNFLFSFTPIAFCIHCYVMGVTEIDEHIFIGTFLMGQSPHIFFGILTGAVNGDRTTYEMSATKAACGQARRSWRPTPPPSPWTPSRLACWPSAWSAPSPP